MEPPDQTEPGSADGATEPAPADARAQAIAQEIHRLVNAERTSRGLKPLTSAPRVAAAAWLHSEEMARLDYFDHTSPTRAQAHPLDRVRNAGILDPEMVGENIALLGGVDGSPAALAARFVRMWMDSPGHRANILRAGFRFGGVGVFERQGRIYATQDFTAAAPPPGSAERSSERGVW